MKSTHWLGGGHEPPVVQSISAREWHPAWGKRGSEQPGSNQRQCSSFWQACRSACWGQQTG